MLEVYNTNLFWATSTYFLHDKVILQIFNKDNGNYSRSRL